METTSKIASSFFSETRFRPCRHSRNDRLVEEQRSEGEARQREVMHGEPLASAKNALVKSPPWTNPAR